MKKALATLATAGVLALTAVAGTTATASAAAPTHASTKSVAWSNQVVGGPYGTAETCVEFVREHNELGVWDCEFLAGPYGGWVALAP
ncbi:hypothetical protein [Kitasatospora viridis]|uniref:Uncharacterized protein n=1 Tax=Kitasatospora viridis TaxID=281105 RepID=A0A561SEB0_9ACTN|nr:hypothetical protein [Kitasatospora viridis]TWF73178.1 hypothetical protein FHX73_16329 [Kitasatospora viridis]